MMILPVNLKSRWDRTPENLRGAMWMLFMAIFFVAADSIIKILSRRLDPIEIVFFRNIFSILWLIPAIANAGGFKAFQTNYPWLQLTRATLGGIAMICIFYSLKLLPLADATAVMFSRAIWMIPCAVLLLGETVQWRRWTATIVGFIGVILMVQPTELLDFNSIKIGMIFALTNAFLAAVIFTLIKILKGRGESNLTILLWHASISILMTSIPTWFLWITPTPFEILLLIALGLIVTLAHSCLIQALAVGEATAVTPFEYSRVLFAGLVGFIFFSEVPSIWSFVGTLLLIASALYIARRESLADKNQKG
ncbi:MAG: DMT family transporter [Pseudomonadota bacterium]|nr:DMT family transporter [Pseudomonadota bacterium]